MSVGEERPLGICGRCYDEGVEIFPATCVEKPEALIGAPIGMYHCPDCGAMVLAGLPHPEVCRRCLEGRRPGWDCQFEDGRDGPEISGVD